MESCESYSSHFVQQGMNSVHHARCYLTGLLGTQRRKNIETIENDVAESDYQGMEQFISSSPWDHETLMEQLAQDLDGLIGSNEDAALMIDESSFLKKGNASVGVQRQQALEMVRAARQRGICFGWVGADSLYGATVDFINGMEDLGEKFVADVHVSNRIWTHELLLEKPPELKGKGWRRKREHLSPENQARYVSVKEWAETHFETESRQIVYRNGSKGPLKACFWVEHAFHEAKSQLEMAQYQVRVWRG